ncbi:MAG: hypothetical protein B6U77_01725 [Candidatus Hecatellales archaeon ex4484_218]|nr:MAG: hypothetical protein B6U77_01725 [Candidatus Hecatellales archaeon ex4484_218]
MKLDISIIILRSFLLNFFLFKEFRGCKEWIKNCFISLRSERIARDYAEAFTQFIVFAKKTSKELDFKV